MSEGCIYLATNAELMAKSVYKIGCTRNLTRRMSELGSACLSKFNPIFYHRCRHYFFLEQQLHEKFKNKRLRNELFELSNDDIQSLKDHCEKYIDSPSSHAGICTFEDVNVNVFVVYDEKHNLWLHAHPFLDMLGYVKKTAAIHLHISVNNKKRFNEFKNYGRFTTPNMQPNSIFINIAGLLQLLQKSTKPNAVKFQEWVTGNWLHKSPSEVFRCDQALQSNQPM